MRLWAVLVMAGACHGQDQPFKPAIPKVWDERALRELELPLANAKATPQYPSADYYYSIPEVVVYKSYSSNPPQGMNEDDYLAWLRQQDPELAFDPAQLRTKEDWVRAGERVFHAPTLFTTNGVREGRFQQRPWFIRKKGVLEKGSACASCHVQVGPNGRLVSGAPFGAGEPGTETPMLYAGMSAEQLQVRLRQDFGTPWLTPDPNSDAKQYGSITVRNGQVARQGTSFLSPPPIPDLIGIQDRRYLDHTGLSQHRSIADLMRYAALNTQNASLQMLGNYDGFIPGGTGFKSLPEPKTLIRYSDAQLYALALFLYSLKPPENPNQPTDLSRAGEKVFQREGCSGCHVPPLYTNNKLVPAPGFIVPDEHKKTYDILPVVVGTDPFLAMSTRRGTGYYKIPSLRGVWYRGPFEHSGSVATLEDWFNEGRLHDDYIPSGFKGSKIRRPVKGHEFGLKLSENEKKALIAFLRTL